MDFLPPSGGVFRLSHLGVIAGYPMQTVIQFSRFGARFGNKKSPHNNLNLTIPSGVALVRVRYVAIRKLKTYSGSFGSRAGTLSKYVILNCWDRLPQKSSLVNVNLSGRGPSILLRKTVLSLKSPTGAFIAPLRKRELLRTRHFRQIARKCSENFGKKREPGGFVLLICFLPTVPGTAPAPHPPARRKCPRGCGTRRPERPDWPPPGTR